jgi:hypothetical protein
MSRHLVALVLLTAAAALPGCAALALPALGAAAVSAGAGSVVKASTEYTLTGVAYRTFSASLDDVHAAMLETFQRLQVDVQTDETTEDGGRLEAAAGRRTIDVRLERITPALTRVRLAVKQSFFRRDRATASEIIAQTEHSLATIAPSAFPASPVPPR